MINKKGQEEIVGFSLIIIIVAVILLIFLSFALRPNENLAISNSYEAENFVQTILHHTTDCANIEPNYYSVSNLIRQCEQGIICHNEKNSCEVLQEELENLIEKGWSIGEERPVKAYSLVITASNRELVNLVEGNKTRNYKGSSQFLSGDTEIRFVAYYSD